MKFKPHKGAWILGVLFFIGVVLPSFSSAQATSGISVTVYDNFGYNNSPPLPEQSGVPVVGTTTFSQINQNFDSDPPFNMYEDFIVKYEGYITAPVTGSVSFWPWADDGTLFYLDGNLIDLGNWVDKGGGGYQTPPQQFTAGVSKPFTYWFYENGGGAWTQLYWDIGNGWEIVPASAFSQIPSVTTTTTVPKSLGKPTNVTLIDTGYAIKVTWNAAEDDINTSPERYAISWSTGNSGWGVATGNVGDQNALKTEIILSYALFSSTGGLDAEYNVAVRADNDTEGVYSQQSSPAFLKIGTIPPPPTTTTTTTTTTTSTTTTTQPPVTTAPKLQPPTTLSDQTTTTSLAPDTTTTTPINVTAITTLPPQTTTTSTTILPVTTTTVLPAQATTTTTLVPEIKEEMSTEEAVSVATNKEVLQEVSKEEAQKIFNSIDTSQITEEQKSEIIQAVQDAPKEVKEAFEQEINIYADGFDDYVPVGSVIDVGTRRSLIAATTVLSTVTVAGAAGGSGGTPPSKPSPTGGGGSGPDPNSAARKEEEKEEDEEESAEIEGPEGDEEENNFTRNSIFKYQEGTMKRTFSPWGFVKKFAKETAALAFTISGTVIVFATLSGETRKITMIATLCAFAVHYLNAMLKNDEE